MRWRLPRPSGTLPVVGRQRRHVAHQHRVELADVDAELQGRGADQAVDRVRCALEQVLQPLPLHLRDHGGVLFRTEHRIGPVQKLQVIVVGVFRHPFQDPPAPPGGASVIGQVPRGLAPAVPATLDAPVGTQAQPIGVHLVDSLKIRQGTAPGTFEPHRNQEPASDQEVEQAFQDRFDVFAGHAPFRSDLAHRGVAALTQPLGDQSPLLRRAPPQLGPDRSEETGQVALLDLPVSLPPVLGEDLVFGVVQGASSPQVIEHAGDAVAEALRRDGQGVGPFLDPGQGRLKTLVVQPSSVPTVPGPAPAGRSA